jgi:mRNA interferase RelE/StbE
MKRLLTPGAVESYLAAPASVRKAFDKQIKLLIENLNHPSLRAKKYGGTDDIWQARVNRNWRLYFRIVGDTYLIVEIIPHPK